MVVIFILEDVDVHGEDLLIESLQLSMQILVLKIYLFDQVVIFHVQTL